MSDVHRFRNNAKAIALGDRVWESALQSGLLDLQVTVDEEDRLRTTDGRRFVNLCSCSYLGLHNHPAILEGAIAALRSERCMDVPISRLRIRLEILDRLEAELSDLFRARAITAISCSAATAGLLPLIASGHLSDGVPPVMVFDKLAHFSLSLIKPICADETTVLTCGHNDLDFIEDACKKHRRVAYVAEGVYSMGGATPLRELLELQDRYGLFLYIDDSHSLSVVGERGEGFVRSSIPGDLSPLTVIVASLCKGFGGSGGVIMLGPADKETLVNRFGGPLAWSQAINVPAMGADLAAAEIHRSPELGRLQRRLRDNLALFDARVDTGQKGDGFPVKLITLGEEERAVRGSQELLRQGYYSSAVFFPIVERGKAGLRVMVRADNRPEDIVEFCDLAQQVALEVAAGQPAG
jgi:7-keto-8-aminopelargonate synthetase-like enzyme